MPRLWDISPPVHAGSPVFPGDTPYSQQWAARIGPGCPVNVSSITTTPHVGAHADAPLHYDPQGASIGAVDLDAYLGPAASSMPSARPAGHLGRHRACGRRPAAARARAHLRARAGGPLGRAARRLRPATIERLADAGVRLVGIDTASIDPAESKDLPSHQAIRRRGLRVLENLVLDDVPEGDYELIALPLKLMTADASPVRAVLRRP
jgi:arylformamidase